MFLFRWRVDIVTVKKYFLSCVLLSLVITKSALQEDILMNWRNVW